MHVYLFIPRSKLDIIQMTMTDPDIRHFVSIFNIFLKDELIVIWAEHILSNEFGLIFPSLWAACPGLLSRQWS